MCEKVKLTQEQADAIEQKKKYDGRGIQAILRDLFYEPNETSIRSVNEIIREIGMEDFLKALYIGYEVEPKFKVRDWVYNKNADVFLQIDDKDMATRYSEFPSIYRHATPEEIAKEKQRRWWAKHDRGVWELAPGDIVFFPGRIYREVTSSVNDCRRGEYTFDDSVDVYKNELINGSYEVVCFAKDRKDA